MLLAASAIPRQIIYSYDRVCLKKCPCGCHLRGVGRDDGEGVERSWDVLPKSAVATVASPTKDDTEVEVGDREVKKADAEEEKEK